MRLARAMWAAVLVVCLEIPDVVAQECGSSSDQKLGLVAAGAATDGQGGFTELYGASAVSTFVRDGSTYAIVAAPLDDGIQLVDVSDPSNPVAVSSATDGEGGFTALAGAQAVSTFVRGDSTYAIVAAYFGDGIQIVDVSDPSNPVAVSSATDGQGGFTALAKASAVSTFVRDGSTYAIVAAAPYDKNFNPLPGGIQLVDVSDPSNPVAVSSATDGEGGFTTLGTPIAVSTFVRGGSTYAIVAASLDNGIQIVDVSDPSNPVAVSSATDGEGGFTTLRVAWAVSTFVRDGSTYAIVAARDDNGIQIVDVSDPSNPVAVSSATDGEGGFTTLWRAQAVSTFVRDGSTYAIVAAYYDDGIQIVDVSDPSNPVVVSSATDGEGGFTALAAAQAVSTFVRDGSTYAIVAGSSGVSHKSIQMISIPDCHCYGISCGEHETCSDGLCVCESVYTGDGCQQFVHTCGNIQANLLFTEFDCTGARYDMAKVPESILCASEACSVRECCTTLRPTCGDTQADGNGTVYDCSLAQKYLNHDPSRTVCEQRGCSVLECCTEDKPPPLPPLAPPPSPPPDQSGPTGVFVVVSLVAAAIAAGLVVRKQCLTKVAIVADAESIYEATDASTSDKALDTI